MMVEMLRPLGAEMGRRWLATLLLVPLEERAAMVAEIERLVSQQYAQDQTRQMTVAHPPEQKDGAVEQVFTTYEVTPAKPKATVLRPGKASQARGRA